MTTVWADEQVYYPVHAVPYTPARHFAKGKNDPRFRTKLAIGAGLAIRAREAGFTFRAVAGDCAYGDQDGFRAELAEAGLPFVMALRPRRGTWARAADAHTPVKAARALAWGGPDDPGDWRLVTRTFRDGHAEAWWAADATLEVRPWSKCGDLPERWSRLRASERARVTVADPLSLLRVAHMWHGPCPPGRAGG